MGNLPLALVIVFGGWWLMRKFASTQPAQIRKLSRKLAGGGITLAGGLLLLRGASNIGLPLIVLGMGLIGETSMFPGGFQWPGRAAGHGQASTGGQTPPPARAGTVMTRDEARAVLGLKGSVSAESVNEAYRRLMKDFHPDRGGTDYLASKINEARDVLLQEFGATT